MEYQLFTWNDDTKSRRFFVNSPTRDTIHFLERGIDKIISTSINEGTVGELSLYKLFQYLELTLMVLPETLGGEAIDKNIVARQLKDYIQHVWQRKIHKLATTIFHMFSCSEPTTKLYQRRTK